MENNNFLNLFLIWVENSLYNLFLSIKELIHFWHSKKWWKIRLFYALNYLIDSPYKIASKYYQTDDSFIYGETPLLTSVTLLKDAKITPDDFLIDLGCGTGKILFGALLYNNMESLGVDLIKEYIDSAQRLKKFLRTDRVDFINKDILNADLEKGTVFFIAATTLSESTINAITSKLNKINHSFKVISISHKIGDQTYTVIKKKSYDFSWGKATVYIQEKQK